MSDNDETNSRRLVSVPPPGGDFDVPAQLPDPDRLFPAPEPEEKYRGDSATGSGIILPPVPGAPDPEMVLRSEGFPVADPDVDEDAEDEEFEYEHPRSFADHLGDWLEWRIERARSRMDDEAPYREAEIARKIALLEAQTARETGLMDAQAKLRQAQAKANADRAGARGKGDSGRSKSAGSAGLGADKGRGKSGGGSGGAGRGSGGSRGGGGNGSGGSGSKNGSGRTPAGSSGKGGAGKGGGSGSPGGSKGRTDTSPSSGSSGRGGSKTGPKSDAGSKTSSKGGGKADKTNGNASSPAAERSRGRQERAAARQAARAQRRSSAQDATLADRTKDRDQDRAYRHKARRRADRQAAKQEKARRKEKEARRAHKEAERTKAREVKAEQDGRDPKRVSLTKALADEAQNRWDKRRKADQAVKEPKDAKADPAKDHQPKEKTKKGKEEKTGQERPKVKLTKDEPGGQQGEKAPGSEKTPSASEPKSEPDQEPASEPRSGATTGGRRRAGPWQRWRTRGDSRHQQRGHRPPWPFGPEPSGPFPEWDAAHRRPPRRRVEPDDPYYPDAVIVPPRKLPPVPDPDAERPDSTRSTTKEDPVASEVTQPPRRRAGMPAKHRTNVTFGQYLTDIVNIALATDLDKERAQETAVLLGKIADALKEMATELADDHNIDPSVVDQITETAEAAARMKQVAERAANECGIAAEGARVAAMSVGRTYSEDLRAMENKGLAQASAAAHHE
ncbi:ATP/GTP-binding protein [Streptomyces sp. 039-1]|uniref:ATP/GTP-binding protein n=1 Tax=Streptomyces sp. 039-1 TaxID=2789263 RepID=UPI0039F5AD1E